MAAVSAFLYKAMAFIMSIVLTAIPYAGFDKPFLQTREDDCQLNLSMISDIHLETPGIFRKGFLKQGLLNINNALSPVDAILVDGDITNYGDEETLASYYDIITDYTDKPVITVAGNHDIGHVGDRDVTDISRDEALANVIKYYNAYSGRDLDTNYYSLEINGYKFIVLGDEVNNETHTGGYWDSITMTQEQLDFLDRELAEGTADGKPVFVCCHWAIKGTNGEQVIWEGSGIDPETEYDIQGIMEKYKNVFYISGHMHGGIKSTAVDALFDINSAEKTNGVTYLSLPTYGILNQYGIPWSGTGAQLEVYSDKVIFRPVNYLTGKWYTSAAYTFTLD